MDINLQDYYNRFAASKNWKRVLTISGRGIQAPEFNEAQDMFALELKRLGDALFSDGTIISGCEVNVDPVSGSVSLGAGRIYAQGMVWPVAAATLQAPAEGTTEIGIRIRERIVTELEDGTLRDPSVGCPNYMQPGAARLTAVAEWSRDADISVSDGFWPVYTVTNRILIVNNRKEKDATLLDGFWDALARYDRDAHGHYVVRGMYPSVVSASGGRQTFNVSEGLAHVRGFEVEFPYSVPLIVDEAPDMQDIEDEPHVFSPGGEGTMRVALRHTPVETIREVGIRKQKTVSIVHGSYSGCSDPLPDTSVVSIVSVSQGGTTYVPAQDYRLTADRVDWSPLGDEPATGSTYSVTYQYRTIVAPISPDTTGFTVAGAVEGSEIFVDYVFRLLRRDLIVVDTDGELKYVRGVSHRYAPAYPAEPSGTLTLARVDQNWSGLPIVRPHAVRVVPMSTLRSMQRNIEDLYDLVAIERLRTDAIISEPTAVHNVFVDPFFDDDMRDHGISQTAAIVDGRLMLPIGAEVVQFNGKFDTLLYEHETVLRQEARTGKMKINPYQAFDPLPPRVSVDPAVDRWNTVESLWTSGITRAFVTGTGSIASTSTSTATEVVRTTVEEAAVMRVRTVAVHAEGFGPGEEYVVLFAERMVASGSADAGGAVDASFDIPSGVPTGVALVSVVGALGSIGETTYTGTGSITTQVLRTVTTTTTTRRASVDPLAQTFFLTESRQVSGVELWFAVKGSSQVRVEIREVENGLPTQKVVTSGHVEPAGITEGGPTRVAFPPVHLQAGTSYALVVLTDTADHELALAELGGWDSATGWVRAQPYGGVLLSSANAETWTAHQTMDLWFRLLAARFAPARRRVSLGGVTLDAVTDLLPLAEVDIPAAGTEATIILTRSGDGSEIRIQPNQVLNMAESASGTYVVEAELAGTEKFSPTLFGGMQLLLGKLSATGDYVSRAFTCGAGKRVSVRVEALLPGTSGMRVYIQTGSGTWTEALLDSFEEVGDGWRRYTHKANCSLGETRVKIVLSGSPAERPMARNLRAVVVDAV
jgi:hypothetical protein